MWIAIIVLGIGLWLYFNSKTNNPSYNNVPTYKKDSKYKNLHNEDRLMVDLTVAMKEVIEVSIELSKKRSYSYEEMVLQLLKDIESCRSKLKDKVFDIAPQYGLPILKTMDLIDILCDGAIETHVANK